MKKSAGLSGTFDSRRHQNAQRLLRRGSLIVEMVVCTVLLSVIAAILVPGIHGVNLQRMAVRFETLARIELNNQAAELQVSEEPLRQLEQMTCGEWFHSRYPSAELSAEVVSTQSADEVAMIPVRLTLENLIDENRPALSQSVVVWVAADGGAE